MKAAAARGADLLLDHEPLWAAPLLVVALTGLLSPWPFLALAVLPWPLRLARRGRLTARTPFDLPIALLVLGLLVGLYAAVDLDVGLQVTASYVAAALLFYLVVNSPGPRYLIAWPALSSALLMAGTVWVFAQVAHNPFKSSPLNAWAYQSLSTAPQLTSYAPHTNGLAVVVVIMVPLLASTAIWSARAWLRVLTSVLACYFLAVILLTTSRSAWVALLVATVVMLYWRIRPSRKWRMVALGGAICLSLLVLGGVVSGFLSGDTLWEVRSGETLISRWQVWQDTLYMLGDVAYTGIGPGSFPRVFPLYMSPEAISVTNPHNALLQLYSDAGLLGLLGGILGTWSFAHLAWRLLKQMTAGAWHGFAVGVVLAALTAGVHGIFESSVGTIFADGSGTFHFVASPVPFLLAGLLVALHQIASRASSFVRPPRVGI